MTVVIPSPATALRAVASILAAAAVGAATGLAIALLIWLALAWAIAAMVGATVVDLAVRAGPALRDAWRRRLS